MSRFPTHTIDSAPAAAKPLLEAAKMAELQVNIPGVRFVTTEFKTHHDRSLTHWNMEDGNGNVLGIGASHFVHGTDGRLMQMTGFFDQPPA